MVKTGGDRFVIYVPDKSSIHVCNTRLVEFIGAVVRRVVDGDDAVGVNTEDEADEEKTEADSEHHRPPRAVNPANRLDDSVTRFPRNE